MKESTRFEKSTAQRGTGRRKDGGSILLSPSVTSVTLLCSSSRSDNTNTQTCTYGTRTLHTQHIHSTHSAHEDHYEDDDGDDGEDHDDSDDDSDDDYGDDDNEDDDDDENLDPPTAMSAFSLASDPDPSTAPRRRTTPGNTTHLRER